MDTTDLTLELSQSKVEDSDTDDQQQLVAADDEENGISVSSQGTLTLDSSGQYHFRTDTGQGQVTYRVVQVAQGEDGQTQVLANPTQLVQGEDGIQMLTAGPLQTAQTEEGIQVIQAPFNGTGAGGPDPLTADSRFSYISAHGSGDATGASTGAATAAAAAEANVTAALGQVASPNGGQFYVMMSPQDVLQAAGPRVIAPRAGVTSRVDTNRSCRDERRRASHNEVERRRRDKMNEWIVQLSKLVPECSMENNKMMKSKGGILAKACEYITDLRTSNSRMSENLKQLEKLSIDNELLRSQIEELKQQNSLLHSQLHQHGIISDDQS